MALLPLYNPPSDDEWISSIGKYMLNLGAIESITRVLIADLNGTDQVPVYSAALAKRLDYLKIRYSNSDTEKYKKVMELFEIAQRHIKYRNIVAHSGIFYVDLPDGTKGMAGLVNFMPEDKNNIAEIISLEEMKGRVNESSNLASKLLELQNDFKLEPFKSN